MIERRQAEQIALDYYHQYGCFGLEEFVQQFIDENSREPAKDDNGYYFLVRLLGIYNDAYVFTNVFVEGLFEYQEASKIGMPWYLLVNRETGEVTKEPIVNIKVEEIKSLE